MMGGNLAGKIIAEAIEKGDVSREGLWRYNVEYMRVYGVKQAGLDVFRVFLLKSISNDDINYGMKYQVITEDDLFRVGVGEELRLNITEKTRRAFRGLRKITMLRQLRDAAVFIKKMKSLYRSYPSPEEFEEWSEEVRQTMKEADRRLSRK
jgi:hypothetical protein